MEVQLQTPKIPRIKILETPISQEPQLSIMSIIFY